MAETTKTPLEIVKENLAKPKVVSADGESVSNYPIADQLEAASAIPKTGNRPGARIYCMKPTGNSAV